MQSLVRPVAPRTVTPRFTAQLPTPELPAILERQDFVYGKTVADHLRTWALLLDCGSGMVQFVLGAPSTLVDPLLAQIQQTIPALNGSFIELDGAKPLPMQLAAHRDEWLQSDQPIIPVVYRNAEQHWAEAKQKRADTNFEHLLDSWGHGYSQAASEDNSPTFQAAGKTLMVIHQFNTDRFLPQHVLRYGNTGYIADRLIL